MDPGEELSQAADGPVRRRTVSPVLVAIAALIVPLFGVCGTCFVNVGLNPAGGTLVVEGLAIGVGLLAVVIFLVWRLCGRDVKMFSIVLYGGYVLVVIVLASSQPFWIGPGQRESVEVRAAAFVGLQETEIVRSPRGGPEIRQHPYWPGVVAWILAGAGVLYLVTRRDRHLAEQVPASD